MPATRIVPAMAVPRVEPRLETLRDRPEISPCCDSGKADCTTLTDGVSPRPRPAPIRNKPGANAQADVEPCARNTRSTIPALDTTNPTTMRPRAANRFARLPATSDVI